MNSYKGNDFDKCRAIIKLSFLSRVHIHEFLFHPKYEIGARLIISSKNNVSTWVFVLLSDFHNISCNQKQENSNNKVNET